MIVDRLFVPLSTAPFEDFKNHGKRYEIRGCERNYSMDHVRTGRRVELRRGYSKGDSLWGTIGEVINTETLDQIFLVVDNYKEVEPRAASVEDAIKENQETLGDKKSYIAFEVILDE